MAEHLLIGIATVIILGVVAEWLAWRVRLPSILLLLVFGFVAGPVAGILDPDELFGELVFPIVSASVAVILYEGGLSLRIAELRDIGHVVRNLVTVGAVATWAVGSVAARYILGFDWTMALLLGAILVVTGPTVIVPLLRHVRPIGQVGSILKWEGIVIDPIGAMLAVLVFEGIIAGQQHAATVVLSGLLRTILVGGILGSLAAMLMILLLRRFWIPDFLQNPVSLTVVIGSFTLSNVIQTESGLLTATVMGLVLANQHRVKVKHIIEFKENLRVLLISSLFILLAARLKLEDLDKVGMSGLAFVGALILIGRPLAVFLSTLRSELNARERIFLSFVAPRGIVAAAVSSIFAYRLAEAGYSSAGLLVPFTFLVIVSTVFIYGLLATPLARGLDLAKPNPQGLVILGAHSWAREIAEALYAEGLPVLLVDTNRSNIYRARMAGLPTFHAGILSQRFLDEVELSGMGRMLALTTNDEANSLATLQFADILGRAEVFQLLAEGEEEGQRDAVSHHLHGRHLFAPGMTFRSIDRLFEAGAKIKKSRLSEEFTYEDFQRRYGDDAIPLFLIDKYGNLSVFTTDDKLTPRPGHTLISLVKTPHDLAGTKNGEDRPR